MISLFLAQGSGPSNVLITVPVVLVSLLVLVVLVVAALGLFVCARRSKHRVPTNDAVIFKNDHIGDPMDNPVYMETDTILRNSDEPDMFHNSHALEYDVLGPRDKETEELVDSAYAKLHYH